MSSHPLLLEELELFDQILMFIGLIFNVLLIIFVVVSILLVFSLLLNSIESKEFDFGVMRLIGLSRFGFAIMIITQAIMFVLPAIISGFICSIPLLYVLYSTMLGEDLGYMPSVFPSGIATAQALFVGLFIPIASSAIPIKRSLAINLNEMLDVRRGVKPASYKITSKGAALEKAPYLIVGSVAAIIGIIVYYGLPAAMLQLNLGALLTIFFLLLLGMLLGLVLITINFDTAL